MMVAMAMLACACDNSQYVRWQHARNPQFSIRVVYMGIRWRRCIHDPIVHEKCYVSTRGVHVSRKN